MANSKLVSALLVMTCLLQLIISIFIIVPGNRLANSCIDFGLNKNIILIGVMMTVVGLIGCIGFGCKDGTAAAAYFVCMVFLFMYMIGVMIYLLVVTRYSPPSSVAEPPSLQPAAAVALSYKEYPLDHFSHLYRRKVTHGFYHWDDIVNCLAPSNGCAYLDRTYNSSLQLFSAKLTPLQFGCCMPPPKCGYTFVSPTNWTSSSSSTNNNNQTNVDCARWNVDPSKLCYDCDSCKAGVLVTIIKRFKSANRILLITFVLAFIVWVCNVGFFLGKDIEYH